MTIIIIQINGDKIEAICQSGDKLGLPPTTAEESSIALQIRAAIVALRKQDQVANIIQNDNAIKRPEQPGGN